MASVGNTSARTNEQVTRSMARDYSERQPGSNPQRIFHSLSIVTQVAKVMYRERHKGAIGRLSYLVYRSLLQEVTLSPRGR